MRPLPSRLPAWVATLSTCLMLASSSADAQIGDPCIEAQTYFERAVAAADEARWADAVDGFRQAYSLCGVPNALFNMGMALRALGQHRAARDAFERLLREAPEWEGAETARAMREEEAARVAIIALVGLEHDVSYTLRLDGREVVESPTQELETDPGHHTLETEREGYEPFRWEGTLRDGQREEVEVTMVPLPEPESGGAAKAILITAAVVLVAGAAGVGVWAARRDADLQPTYDDVLAIRY